MLIYSFVYYYSFVCSSILLKRAESFRCLSKALVLQMMTITLIRMPQSFLSGAPLFLRTKAHQKWTWLFARAKQRDATPDQLKRDLEAGAAWVVGPRTAGAYSAADVAEVDAVYRAYHLAAKQRREVFFKVRQIYSFVCYSFVCSTILLFLFAFFKFAVIPTIKFLEREVKGWSASSAADAAGGGVCHYDPAVAQAAHELVAGLGMPLANFRWGPERDDGALDLEDCSAVPGMENISGGGASSGAAVEGGGGGSDGEAAWNGDAATHHHFYFDYGAGFAFDIKRLKTSINASTSTISARKIAEAGALDPHELAGVAHARNWRYWPDAHANESQVRCAFLLLLPSLVLICSSILLFAHSFVCSSILLFAHLFFCERVAGRSPRRAPRRARVRARALAHARAHARR